MSASRMLGGVMVAAPFLAMTALLVSQAGWRWAVLVWGAVMGTVFICGVGLRLMLGD